ncbi:MAG: hypothetical protein EB084_22265, partial [Proteobacteria bacterium]|nr:hypothetical protein [Pseudomonadota bacterium]
MKPFALACGAAALLVLTPPCCVASPSPGVSSSSSVAPTLSSVLETVVPPQSAAARDAVQNVIDHGWPSPAAAQPVEAWRAAGRNVIEGLRLVADRGAFDLRVDDARLRSSRNTLTRLRLAVALTLVDGEQ